MVKFRNLFYKFSKEFSKVSKDVYNIFNDESGQGATEVLLLLGAVLVVVLILVYIYRSYVVDLTSEISSNELNQLNNSFLDLSNKFD